MATGTTTTAQLIVPEVWADAVAPVILGRSVMLPMADADDTLTGIPGETVIFPKWLYIGDAEDLAEGVAMDTTQLTMIDSRATIKEAGKAVELTDNATLNALGNPNSQAQVQLALAVARKIDVDLRKAAEFVRTGSVDPEAPNTAPLAVAVADKPLSWSRLVRGFALLGDDYAPSEIAGILVHSTQHMQLMLDPNFLSADKMGPGAVLQRGQVGTIGTIPVVISDRATEIVVGAGVGYNALIILKGALALKYKRRPIVETDRDILKRTNIITTNVHYAAHRTNDRGIIVVPTNAVIPAEA